MQDDTGFRPICSASLDDEIDEERAASLATMNHTYDYSTGTIEKPSTSTSKSKGDVKREPGPPVNIGYRVYQPTDYSKTYKIKPDKEVVSDNSSGDFWSGVKKVVKDTVINALATAAGGATSGVVAGAMGAPFTATASLPTCARMGALVGSAGGAVSGFVTGIISLFTD